MPVATVVAMVADGMTVDEILREHPDLEAGDVAEALRYAAEAVRKRGCPPPRRVRFLVDQNLSPEVARPLTKAGHDAFHLRDDAMQRATDEQVLDFARLEERGIISADSDFGFLLARFGLDRSVVPIATSRERTARWLNRFDSSSTTWMALRTTSTQGALWCSPTSMFGSDASRCLRLDTGRSWSDGTAPDNHIAHIGSACPMVGRRWMSLPSISH